MWHRVHFIYVKIKTQVAYGYLLEQKISTYGHHFNQCTSSMQHGYGYRYGIFKNNYTWICFRIFNK